MSGPFARLQTSTCTGQNSHCTNTFRERRNVLLISFNIINRIPLVRSSSPVCSRWSVCLLHHESQTKIRRSLPPTDTHHAHPIAAYVTQLGNTIQETLPTTA